MDLDGILIPAVTPFTGGRGDLDLVGLRANLRSWLEHPVRGIVVAGSTGEAVLLEEDERVRLLEGARAAMEDDRLLVAGTGAESRRATVRRCREAAAAGADAVLVQPPAFYRDAMAPVVLADHYRAVADASPVPVIVYQVPPRLSTLELAPGLVAELSTHENIVGVKDSRGDLGIVGDLVTRCRPGFRVLVGSGALLYAALEVGAAGGILASANLAPEDTCRVMEAFREGRMVEAGRLQERLAPLHREIVTRLGVPGVKAALDLLGLQGGEPRPPLRPVEATEVDRIREVLAAAGLAGVAA